MHYHRRLVLDIDWPASGFSDYHSDHLARPGRMFSGRGYYHTSVHVKGAVSNYRRLSSRVGLLIGLNITLMVLTRHGPSI